MSEGWLCEVWGDMREEWGGNGRFACIWWGRFREEDLGLGCIWGVLIVNCEWLIVNCEVEGRERIVETTICGREEEVRDGLGEDIERQ